MLKRSVLLITVLAGLALQACSQKYDKTENGLEYKFAEKHEGKRPKTGDIMSLHLSYRNEKDSLLGTTHSTGEGKPITVVLPPPSFKGSFEEGLALMAAGDTAMFYINSDSIIRNPAQRPPFIREHSKISYGVKMYNVWTKDEFKTHQLKELTKYAADKGLKVTTTASGLMYAITTKGTGPKAQFGDSISVHYTGKTLDGRPFDSSVPSGSPYKLTAGNAQVIAGWNEGLQLLSQGDKAVFIVPYNLGYGEQGNPPIQPFQPMVFDIEMVRVKAKSGTAKPAAPAGTVKPTSKPAKK